MKLFRQKTELRHQPHAPTWNQSQIDGISAKLRRIEARVMAVEDQLDTIAHRINRAAVRASASKREQEIGER